MSKVTHVHTSGWFTTCERWTLVSGSTWTDFFEKWPRFANIASDPANTSVGSTTIQQDEVNLVWVLIKLLQINQVNLILVVTKWHTETNTWFLTHYWKPLNLWCVNSANKPAMLRRTLLNGLQLFMSMFLMNLYIYLGETAWVTCRFQYKMLYKPTPLMNKSHKTTTGANIKPILCVPKCWSVKRPTNMAHAVGTGTSVEK